MYRMVPKRDDRVFVATVLTKDAPAETRLSLVAPDTSVAIKVTLHKLAWDRTRFVSEETFRFRGLLEAFKRFAERYPYG